MMARCARLPGCAALLLAAWLLTSLPARAERIIRPTADGTLADGGSLGNYDGIVDGWNWVFGPSGFAGAVTLTTETQVSAVEHRIVFEYDLRGVTLEPPVKATLTFTARGVLGLT